jgi:hypothetical protein
LVVGFTEGDSSESPENSQTRMRTGNTISQRVNAGIS